jgi:hypothetical protein
MDADHFDRLIRGFGLARPRRAMLSLSLGGVIAGLGRETAPAKNKGKGKKGCPKGKKKCGKKCIAKGECCHYYQCRRLCGNEDCINGKCQCNSELIMHNGMCGYFIDCKGFGETCTSHAECCGSCVSGQCGKSIYHCIADGDCESGPCRGFLCPEAWEPYFDLYEFCRP